MCELVKAQFAQEIVGGNRWPHGPTEAIRIHIQKMQDNLLKAHTDLTTAQAEITKVTAERDTAQERRRSAESVLEDVQIQFSGIYEDPPDDLDGIFANICHDLGKLETSQADIAELQGQGERYRAALEFYARLTNYQGYWIGTTKMLPQVHADKGVVAMAALNPQED